MRLERESMLRNRMRLHREAAEIRRKEEAGRDAGATSDTDARATERRLAELFSERIETYLDSGHGACCLTKPAMAQMVAKAIQQFEGERYRLWAWCVMPNHVHAVMELEPGQ